MIPEAPLPYGIRVLSALSPMFSALATLCVGMVVATIAYRQWRTAHEKVMLDLFDRRFKIHERYQECLIKLFTTDGNLVGSQTRFALQLLWSESRFLFGPEVPDYIKRTMKMIVEWEQASKRIAESDGSLRDVLSQKASKLDEDLTAAHREFSDLLMPYLKMDQRRR